MKLVFVGDKPSKKNTNPNVPFVGTKSYVNLLTWIDKLEVSEYILTNSYSTEDKIKINQILSHNQCKWIALGNEASKVLKDLNINHFKLPHPSPRNRMLNDKSFIEIQLKKCNTYIKQELK